MNQKYPNLAKPIKIGKLTLRNRIMAAPLSLIDLTPEGFITQDARAVYELRAAGGAAVVTIGESITDSATGKSKLQQICLDDPNVIQGLTHTALAIKRMGALASIELSHGGKYTGYNGVDGLVTDENAKPYGPSDAVAVNGMPIYEMPKEMIYHIIEKYGRAAAVVKAAGFDMLMIHAAHGWMLGQFMSPRENHRTDEFGGSMENRCRFAKLVLQKVRSVVGPDFPIELRINGDDFLEGSLTLEDYKEIIPYLEEDVDLINVSCAAHEGEGMFIRVHPNSFLPQGCNAYLAKEIKKVVSKPVSCIGSVNTPEMAEQILANGEADLVALGRQMIADSYWPKKALSGREDDITPCIRCYQCFETMMTSGVLRCSVNPLVGQELANRYGSPYSGEKKKILIAGGGPAGMEAALAAAENGHTVILCEEKDELGGTLRYTDHVPFKRDLNRFMNVLIRRVEEAPVDVWLSTKVDAALIEAEQPDVLIAAIGAKPVFPAIDGLDEAKVWLPLDAEKHPEQLGDRVVVIGGGLVGCGTGIFLGMNNKEVTVIEQQEIMAKDSNPYHRMAVDVRLEQYVTCMTETKVCSIQADGVACKKADGKTVFVPADSIVLAAGMRSDSEGLEQIGGLVQECYTAGDCIRPGQVMQAVSTGYYAGWRI